MKIIMFIKKVSILIHFSCYHFLKSQIIHFNCYTFLFYEKNHVYKKKSIHTNSFFLLSFFEVIKNHFNSSTRVVPESRSLFK